MDLASRLDAQHLSVYRAMPADLLAELSTDIPTVRARSAELAATVARPAWPDDVATEDHHAPAGDGTDVLVRLYRPASAPSPAPALFWVHGGGLVMGSVAQNDDMCAAIADRLGIVVASVEYRLAPEHPYPTPLEDCYAGLHWMAGRCDELGIDRTRVAIGGASAGGGLAAGLALVAHDRAEVAVCFQLLVYPMLDDRNVTPSSHAVVDPKVWNREANAAGWNAYLAGRAGADDVEPYAAPARATDLAGLPPAYIAVGDLDLFLDEDIAYAQTLMGAGVPVELHVYPGAFHGSNNFVSRSTLSRRWNADEQAALARALGVEPRTAAMSLEVGAALQSANTPASEARELEAAGFHYACAGEHVSFNVPAGNSFISLSVAAGATTTIKLMSTVVLAPLYPPALLAKLGAALDVASGGRYHLGVGIGGEIPAEFRACGIPVGERGARTNEALEIIRLLWTTDRASFRGRFNDFDEVTISPRRDRPPPIWVSGRANAAMHRAARFGDGWLPYMYTPEMLGDSLTTIESRRDRDEPVRTGVFIWGCVHEDADIARRMAIEALSKTYAQDFSRLVDKYAFAGTPDDVVTRLGQFADAGANTVIVSFACPRDHLDTARRLFAERVLPALVAR